MLNDGSHMQKQREDMMNPSQIPGMMHSASNQRMPRLNHFEAVGGMDPHFPDYSSQIMSSMDSPNMDNAYQVIFLTVPPFVYALKH